MFKKRLLIDSTRKSTNQMLSVTYNNNTKGKVNSTPILKKKYEEKIEAKTTPGYDRAKRNEGGVGKAISLLEYYWQMTGKQETEKEKTQTMLNLIANHKGEVLADRETIYWLSHKGPYVAGKKFSAERVLENMLDLGIIKEYSKSYHTKGVAREAQVTKVKGLSTKMVAIIEFYLNTDLGDLLESIQDERTPQEKRGHKIDMEMILQEAWDVSKDPQYNRRAWAASKLITKFKNRQRREGITVSLIHDWTNSLCSGYQPDRKRYIVKLLADHYNLNPQTIKQTLEGMEEEEKEIEEQIALLEVKQDVSFTSLGYITDKSSIPQEYTDLIQRTPAHIHIDTDRAVIDTEVIDKDMDKDEDMGITDVGEYTSENTSEDIKGEEGMPEANRGHLGSVEEIYNPAKINSIEELHRACAELRRRAASVMVEESTLRVGAYNQAIEANILRYTPYDIIDVRQKEVMIREGALPTEYQLCSGNSPRVYGRGVDNLFYCRKRMRLAAFESLGFQDVDISGCHVHVALGLWGEHLPLLGKHVAKGSLWSHYEGIYREEGVPYYKSLMKAMHHATLLGGGMNAYREAHRTYNNHHPEAPITGETLERIIEVFKATDIYKELKGLFKHLDRTYHKTSITVLTGERFQVRGYRRRKDKKTGKVYTDKGNLLTVIAAILQSFEVAMLSYLILRANQLFIPVLWQHDGLTIKALYSNTVEMMQEVLDEFTLPLLHRSFKLETTNL